MDLKNILAAISLSAAVIILYSLFFAPPPPPDLKKIQTEKNTINETSDAPSLEESEQVSKISRNEAIIEKERILFENNNIKGSILLKGSSIDDLTFKNYTKTLNGKDNIVLLNPKKVKNGYYIEPTIIEGLDYNCRTNQEEIFGPVVTITPFDTEEEVIMMANSTKYGLSASIFTENISKGHRVSRLIDSGVVWINTWLLRDLRIPFGGMKNSGVGREGGIKSLQFFTEEKNVCLKI